MRGSWRQPLFWSPSGRILLFVKVQISAVKVTLAACFCLFACLHPGRGGAKVNKTQSKHWASAVFFFVNHLSAPWLPNRGRSRTHNIQWSHIWWWLVFFLFFLPPTCNKAGVPECNCARIPKSNKFLVRGCPGFVFLLLCVRKRCCCVKLHKARLAFGYHSTTQTCETNSVPYVGCGCTALPPVGSFLMNNAGVVRWQ